MITTTEQQILFHRRVILSLALEQIITASIATTTTTITLITVAAWASATTAVKNAFSQIISSTIPIISVFTKMVVIKLTASQRRSPAVIRTKSAATTPMHWMWRRITSQLIIWDQMYHDTPARDYLVAEHNLQVCFAHITHTHTYTLYACSQHSVDVGFFAMPSPALCQPHHNNISFFLQTSCVTYSAYFGILGPYPHEPRYTARPQLRVHNNKTGKHIPD